MQESEETAVHRDCFVDDFMEGAVGLQQLALSTEDGVAAGVVIEAISKLLSLSGKQSSKYLSFK